MARDPSARRRAILAVAAVIATGVLGGTLSVVGAVLMALPTFPTTVADLHPPIEDRSGRRADPSRCGLNQVRTDSGCARAAPTSTVEEEVVFPSRIPEKGLDELHGTLARPVGLEGPRPAVVIVPGSGAPPRDGGSPGDLIARYDPPFDVYRALSDAFVAQGLIVLRYDKRTSPVNRDKPIDWHQFSVHDQIADTRDALDYLASRPDVDGEALVVLGHSEGGMLAPHVVRGDDRVAAVILMGGSTQTLGHAMIEQLERLGEVRKHQGDYATQWMLGPARAPIRRCFEPIWAGTHDPDEVCIGGVPQRAIAEWEALADTTGAVLGELEMPVMAIQGSCDINIDPLEIPRMQAILAGRDAELHYVRGLDHSLTDSLDPTDPVSLDEEALRRFEAFFASVPWR